ncbi:GTP-binding protein Era [Parelusimicrobium proximum]|uniref:GTPase Era n=1 Tax=Parelusimicrobium proximum TaxID=3228953 RepID=UPI003D18362D
MTENNNFKSGFAAIVGLPNAGKSTLTNLFAGALLSPMTHKPQTTRQNILAISEGDNYQIVFVDTPGFLSPKYKLQKTMLSCVDRAIKEDADIILFLIDPLTPLKEQDALLGKLKKALCPIFLVINKTDSVKDEARIIEAENNIKAKLDVTKTFRISALKNKGIQELKEAVIAALPESPAYFHEGTWTDRWERFYVSEFIREQIFMLYDKEVPYCTTVEIEKFTEDLGDKNFIQAVVHVERESQKPIIIGKKGANIAKLRTAAQKRINEFLGRKYRLELVVRVSPNWRSDNKSLKEFGYIED